MKSSEFNILSDREKWDIFWKSFESDKSLEWNCKHCGSETNSPWRASPFSGSSIHCGECDGMLSKRTNGGQNDPFNWILK